MAARIEGQDPFPITVDPFEGLIAQQLHELSIHFGVEPERLIRYGLGVLDVAKREFETTGIEYEVTLMPKSGAGQIIHFPSPQEARANEEI